MSNNTYDSKENKESLIDDDDFKDEDDFKDDNNNTTRLANHIKLKRIVVQYNMNTSDQYTVKTHYYIKRRKEDLHKDGIFILPMMRLVEKLLVTSPQGYELIIPSKDVVKKTIGFHAESLDVKKEKLRYNNPELKTLVYEKYKMVKTALNEILKKDKSLTSEDKAKFEERITKEIISTIHIPIHIPKSDVPLSRITIEYIQSIREYETHFLNRRAIIQEIINTPAFNINYKGYRCDAKPSIVISHESGNDYGSFQKGKKKKDDSEKEDNDMENSLMEHANITNDDAEETNDKNIKGDSGSCDSSNQAKTKNPDDTDQSTDEDESNENNSIDNRDGSNITHYPESKRPRLYHAEFQLHKHIWMSAMLVLIFGSMLPVIILFQIKNPALLITHFEMMIAATIILVGEHFFITKDRALLKSWKMSHYAALVFNGIVLLLMVSIHYVPKYSILDI